MGKCSGKFGAGMHDALRWRDGQIPMPRPLSYCAEQVRSFDRERYLTALFAPAGRREALFALFAFNLEIAKTREVAREPLIGRMRLQWWDDALAELFLGRAREHPVLATLAPLTPLLSHARLARAIAARALDLETAPFATLADLERYAEDSAGTILEATLGLLDANDDASLAAARDVGAAWGMLGQVRAVPFQAPAGRAALPRDLLAAAGLDPERLSDARGSVALAGIVAAVARRAQARLRAARALAGRVSPAALPALLLARLADPLLARLERATYDPWNVPARPSFAPLRVAYAWRRQRF